MEDYNNKTKAELLEIIQNLEKKVEQLSSESASGRKERFRDRYSKRILDNLPDMLTVLDRNANIVELVSSPSTNHVEGTTADSITQSNIKDILPEDAYNNIRRNMEKVFSTGNSAIARHDLMQDAYHITTNTGVLCSTKNTCYACAVMFRNSGKQSKPMPNNKMRLCGSTH